MNSDGPKGTIYDHEAEGDFAEDLWIKEWAAMGITELSPYLARHAAFSEFLQRKEQG